MSCQRPLPWLIATIEQIQSLGWDDASETWSQTIECWRQASVLEMATATELPRRFTVRLMDDQPGPGQQQAHGVTHRFEIWLGLIPDASDRMGAGLGWDGAMLRAERLVDGLKRASGPYAVSHGGTTYQTTPGDERIFSRTTIRIHRLE